MTATKTVISISLRQHRQEREYQTFPVTADGLRAAAAKLDVKVYQGYYGLSPWQFDQPWDGSLETAERLLRAGDVAGLTAHLAACIPQV